jgi:LPXTG-motif cell wall-anchored protein
MPNFCFIFLYFPHECLDSAIMLSDWEYRHQALMLGKETVKLKTYSVCGARKGSSARRDHTLSTDRKICVRRAGSQISLRRLTGSARAVLSRSLAVALALALTLTPLGIAWGGALPHSAASVAFALSPQSVPVGDFTLSATNGGADPVVGTDYTYSGNVLTITSSLPITISGTTSTNKIVVDASAVAADITFQDLSITNAGGPAFSSSSSNLSLTLVGTNSLTSGDPNGTDNNSGLELLGSGANLTITAASTGSLTAKAKRFGAGIGAGGTAGAACGNITINGGTIVAASGTVGAGIGAGDGTSCGNITITGGDVTATGGAAVGAGIGSSNSVGTNASTCGNITITSGKVKAISGAEGAGIGSGSSDPGLGSVSATCGDIKIINGDVEASAGNTGAGIGAGHGSPCGSITIEGGTVTATGASSAGAGIGAGADDGAGKAAPCANISISGGDITATGGGSYGAGIGGGYKSPSGNIAISNGTIEASGGAGIGGAGIGGGSFESPSGTIEITGGKIEATGGREGAGIGGGDEASPSPSITISGSDITALGGTNHGAGIGGGETNSGIGTIIGTIFSSGPITISNSQVVATARGGGAGIGGGSAPSLGPLPSSSGDITINGGTITATGGPTGGGGIGGGISYSSSGSITINGGTITAEGGTGGGAGIGAGGVDNGSINDPSVSGAIVINGGTITAGHTSSNSKDIGKGSTYSSSGAVFIDGGSVWASLESTPTNSGGSAVYPNTITIGNPAVASGLAVDSGVIDGVVCATDPAQATGNPYGINDTFTNNSGQVQLWLPDNPTGSVQLSVANAAYLLSYPRSSSNPTATLGPVTIDSSINPSEGNFATVTTPYTQPASREFTIKNEGTATLTSLAATLDGADASAFEISSPLSKDSLAPGEEAKVSVRPKANLSGHVTPYTDTLQITGANNVTHSVSLSFTVSTYAAEITPDNHSLGQAPAGYNPADFKYGFTVENKGTAKLENLKFTLGNAADFEIVGLVPDTVSVGSPVTVYIQPKAGLSTVKTYNGTVTVTGDNFSAGDTVNFNFTFTHTYAAEITPDNHSLGQAPAGYNPADFKYGFTVENKGTTTLSNLKFTLGNATDFEIVDTVPTTLPVGSPVTVYIQPKAGLSTVKTYNGTVTVTGDNFSVGDTVNFTFTVAPSYGISIDPPEGNFATATTPYTQPASREFTIKNEGTATLTSLAAALDGTDASAFEISSPLSEDSLAPGKTAVVSVRPKTDLPGRVTPYDAALKIAGANNVAHSVPLTFTVNTYAAEITPKNYEFGPVTVGYDSATLRHGFTVKNTGSVTLNNPHLVLDGADAADFELTGAVPTTLPVGDTVTVYIQPKAGLSTVKTYEGTLTITADNFSPGSTEAFSFTVVATPSYSATLTPRTYDFGTTIAGYDAPALVHSFTLTNTGTTTLTSISYFLSGTIAGFEIVNIPDIQLAPRASTIIEVQPLAGLDIAAYKAELVAVLPIPGQPAPLWLTSALSFEVIATPIYSATLTPTIYDFGKASEGYSASTLVRSFTLTNTGTATVNSISYYLDGANAASFEIVNTPAAQLAPGASTIIEVQPLAGLDIAAYEAELVASLFRTGYAPLPHIPVAPAPLVLNSTLSFEVTPAESPTEPTEPKTEDPTPSTGDAQSSALIGIAGVLGVAGITLVTRRKRAVYAGAHLRRR